MKKKYIILLCVLVTISQSCRSYSPVTSSHVKIALKSGKSIYVNRLARGVTYDVMWITSNSGECRTPSKTKDIYIDEGGLYYKILRDGSFCIITNGALNVPHDFAVVIKQGVVHPKDWAQVRKRYEAGEIQRLVLDLPKDDPCIFRWAELKDLFGALSGFE